MGKSTSETIESERIFKAKGSSERQIRDLNGYIKKLIEKLDEKDDAIRLLYLGLKKISLADSTSRSRNLNVENQLTTCAYADLILSRVNVYFKDDFNKDFCSWRARNKRMLSFIRDKNGPLITV